MNRTRTSFLLILVIGVIGLIVLMVPRPTPAAASLVGANLHGRPAPNFTLIDQSGRTISLSQFRGEPVLLTFIEASCKETCPLVAENIHRAVANVDRAGGHAAVLAITAAPEDDTPALVRQFSREHGLLGRWHYLSGSRASLTPVWHSYAVYVAPRHAPAILRDNHTSAVFLIDSRGRERVLMAGNPSAADLTRDLRLLAGLPPSDASQVAGVPRPGQMAPDFTARDLHGKTVRLSQYRGSVVLLNFWATWCPACQREMPLLNAWYAANAAAHLVVLGVDKQESISDVRSFVRAKGLRYPLTIDENGGAVSAYALPGMPASFVIDRSGRVRGYRVGELDHAWLQKTVEPVLYSFYSSTTSP